MSTTQVRLLFAVACLLWLSGTAFQVAIWAHHGFRMDLRLVAVLIGTTGSLLFGRWAIKGKPAR